VYKNREGKLCDLDDDDLIQLSVDQRKEASYWLHNLDKKNGRPIVSARFAETVSVSGVTVSSDASVIGFGAVLEGCTDVKGNFPVQGLFDDELIGSSSTLRELVGLHRALVLLSKHVQGRTVCVRMDSMPAVRNLIKGGGSKPRLVQVVKEIDKWKDEMKVNLTYSWVCREENKEADELSRPSSTAWEIIPHSPADEIIRKLVGLFSLRSSARDIVNYSGLVVILPDFNAIHAVIGEVKKRHRKIWLIHPEWSQQTWWPVLQQCSIRRVALGKIGDSFRPVGSDKMEPAWRMCISFIDGGLI
jgi:hypothetical protein